MARIRNIEIGPPKGQLHRTSVDAIVRIFGQGADGPVVQIDTFGSQDREIPGKLSQTIQLDRRAALQLTKILKDAYGD